MRKIFVALTVMVEVGIGSDEMMDNFDGSLMDLGVIKVVNINGEMIEMPITEYHIDDIEENFEEVVEQ